jgi:Tfp pilus assembly protein PilN
MATMTAPPAPPAPTPGEHLRHPNIYANLMPDEVIAARDTRRLKQRIVVALGALVALLVLVYFISVIQTAHARGQLSAAQTQATKLTSQQKQYAPLVKAQSQAQAIRSQLGRLMQGDIQWKPMLTTLRKAPSGIAISSAAMTVTTGVGASNTSGSTAQNAGTNVLNQTGKAAIGTLTVTGVASDKNAVAAYVDYLATVPGFAAPFPTNVTLSANKYQFTISVLVTSDVLGGRFSANATQGGK